MHFYIAKIHLSPCTHVQGSDSTRGRGGGGGKGGQKRELGWASMEAAFARQPFRDVFNREVVLFLMNEGDVRGAMEHFRRLAARVAGVCVSGGEGGGGISYLMHARIHTHTHTHTLSSLGRQYLHTTCVSGGGWQGNVVGGGRGKW